MPKFDFRNRQDQLLAGRLELPQGAPKAFAIFAHCFTCSKNVKAATQVSRKLAEFGIAVLRFDFTGLGNSEGDFANTDFSSNVLDLVDAAAALEQDYEAPTFLIGHSLGGAAALLAAPQLESIRGVATIGAPSDPAHVERLISRTTVETEHDGSTVIELGGRQVRLSETFLDDLQSNRVLPSLRQLRRPLLLFHSPIDEIVSIENARELYESAAHPKSFISIDGSDHMLTQPRDALFVASALSAWAERYLEAAPTTEPADNITNGEVAVIEQEATLSQKVMTSDHLLYADEPLSLGGKNIGPNPYELLLASLGTCTSMTLRMYANRKQWPLKSIRIRLSHSRVHAKDCEDCESSSSFVDQIIKVIELTGELSDSQLERLAEIADRCPVHRTLMNQKQIVSKIEFSEA